MSADQASDLHPKHDSNADELVPLAGAQAPAWAGLPHQSPYLLRVVPGATTASRSVPHVSNIEYLRWVDRAAELHARQLGLSRESLLDANRMWFVSRHELLYLAECWPGDDLRVATWVRSVGRTRSWRDTAIWRESDRRVVFRASTLWVLVDILSRRPTRIDAEMSRLLAPLDRESSCDAAHDPSSSTTG